MGWICMLLATCNDKHASLHRCILRIEWLRNRSLELMVTVHHVCKPWASNNLQMTWSQQKPDDAVETHMIIWS
jgi:hypothetical protein